VNLSVSRIGNGRRDLRYEPFEELVCVELGYSSWVRGGADTIVEPAKAEGAHVNSRASWTKHDNEAK
jgi:hypothetical protein